MPNLTHERQRYTQKLNEELEGFYKKFKRNDDGMSDPEVDIAFMMMKLADMQRQIDKAFEYLSTK